MTEPEAKPLIYLKQGCPFCFKLQVFLLEAGLIDSVDLETIVPDSAEDAKVRAELAPVFERVTYPTARLAPGKYLTDSDALIQHFAGQAGVDPATLPLFNAYLDGPFKSIMTLFKEVRDLRQQAASAG